MIWLKLLFVYPFIALTLYMTSGKTIASLMLCIVMLVLIKLSTLALREIANQ